MRRTSRILLEVTALLAAGLAVLGVLAALRLASGPMSVGMVLSPYVIAALEPEDGSFKVTLDDTVLAWNARDRALQLRAVGLRIADPSGRIHAAVPELTIGLSAQALLHGRLAPTSLEVVGLRLALHRDEGGAIHFAQDAAARQSATQDAARQEATQPAEQSTVAQDASPDQDANSAQDGRSPQPEGAPAPEASTVVPPAGSPPAVPPSEPQSPQTPRVDSNVMGRLIAELVAPPNPDSDFGYLTRITLLDADVFLDDRRLGVVWRAPSSTFAVLRGERGIRLRGAFGLELGGEIAEFDVDALYSAAREEVDATLTLHEIDPSLFASRGGSLAAFDVVKVPISGSLRVRAALDGTVSVAELNLVGGVGEILLPWMPVGPAIPVRALALRGELRDNLTVLDLDQATIDMNGPVIDARLSVKATTPGILGGAFDVSAEAALRALPMALLHQLWPPDAVANARRWVTTNVRDGQVDEAHFSFSGKAAEGSLETLEPETVDGRFTFSGVAVDYFAPLPPVQQGRGSAEMNRESLTFVINGGEANGLQIDSGKVVITGLDAKDQDLSVEAALRGGLRQTLEILDSPRLGYAKDMGVRPSDVGGQMAARLAVKLPLIDDLTFQQVQIAASARTRGASLPKIAFDLDLTEGNFTLQLDGRSMDVTGTARLGSTPTQIAWTEIFNARDVQRRLKIQAALDDAARQSIGLDFDGMVGGIVDVNATLTETAKKARSLALTADLKAAELNLNPIGWRKAVGTPGTLKADVALAGERVTAIRNLSIEAADLRATGSMTFAPNGKDVASAQLTRLVYGHTDVTVEAKRQNNGGYDVAVKGAVLDTEPFFNLGDDVPVDPKAVSTSDSPPPLSIVLAVDKLRLGEGGGLSDVSGQLRREGKLWRFASIHGQPAPGKTFMLRLTPGSSSRTVDVRSNDAGSVLKALDVTPDFVGGQLVIDGKYDDSVEGSPLAGRMLIENFHLINAPGLAKLLSVASLTGVLNLLRGDGISFTRFETPFTLKDDVIEVKNTRMHGPALGFTAEGWISLRDDTLALRGTVVPAYTLNSILGNIPILGQILTGGEGSGVFAATYRMTGKLDDPNISVNPLATLTPGFLRGLFGIFEGEMPQAPDATQDPSQVQEPPPPKSPIAPDSQQQPRDR